jgi:uncharacterized membrane protein
VTTPGLDPADSFESKLQHRAFDAAVLLKGLNGLLEIAGGVALTLATNASILRWVQLFTRSELSEDPRDFIANSLVHWAETFGQDSRIYVAAYLVLHGAAKITLAGLLLHGTKWAYPAAAGFISLFVAYAGYRLSFGWSLPLAAIVVLDVFTLWIIGREWRARCCLTHAGQSSFLSLGRRHCQTEDSSSDISWFC